MPATPPLPPNPCIGIIVGRDLVGDALIKLPFVRALRNALPASRIHWITSQGPTAFGGALRAATSRLIDAIYETPEWLATSSKPSATGNAPHFGLLIDTRNRWREVRFAKRIPHNIYIAMAMRYLFSDRRPPFLKKRPQHLCDRLLQMVELAVGYMPPSTGSLPVPEDLMKKAQMILPGGKTYIGLAPGCSTIVRMWPRYKFEKVAIAQAAKGRVPVFILGPQELDWYDELKATVPSAKFPLQDYDIWGTAQLTLDHTLAIGKQLTLSVGNDSGPGHILAAVDCPLVSLFGPTTPLKAAPRTRRIICLRAQDFGDAQMNAIPWEAVDQAIDHLLANQKS